MSSTSDTNTVNSDISEPMKPGEKQPSRAKQRENTRSSLLYAAADEFANKGFTATNLADVAQRVGVTRGLLHFYFRTKPELAAEIITQFHRAWPSIVERSRRMGGSRLDAMKWLSHAAAERYRTDPFVRAAIRLTRERDLLGIDTPEPFVAWIEFASELIQRGQENGEFRTDIDADTTASFLVSSYYGLQFVSGDLHNWDDIHDRLDDLWKISTAFLVESEK